MNLFAQNLGFVQILQLIHSAPHCRAGAGERQCASKLQKPLPRVPREGPYHSASKTVSRVLYLTVIYLDAPLPVRSSHPGSGRASLYAPIPVLLRIEFTASRCSHVTGELLPRLSTLTVSAAPTAVYLCCTFPQIALGGRYPLSLPCGARTFLMDGLSAWPRDCLFYSHCLFYRMTVGLSTRKTPLFPAGQEI